MVLGQSQSRPRIKLPTTKDHRYSECRLLDSPANTSKDPLETCTHSPEVTTCLVDLTPTPSKALLNPSSPQPDFTPSPNPFTPLTTPKPHWDFGQIHTPDTNLRRRGKRGGKRHRPAPRPTDSSSETIDEICRKIFALRLNDIPTPPRPVVLAESVRHHWAPQFRPNDASGLLKVRLDIDSVESSGAPKLIEASPVLTPPPSPVLCAVWTADKEEDEWCDVGAQETSEWETLWDWEVDGEGMGMGMGKVEDEWDGVSDWFL